jgi:hypothetical protein
MSNAVVDDYFSFMSAKSGSKAMPGEPRVLIPPAMAVRRPDAGARESQMEVIESSLSDTAIERIFRPPTAG